MRAPTRVPAVFIYFFISTKIFPLIWNPYTPKYACYTWWKCIYTGCVEAALQKLSQMREFDNGATTSSKCRECEWQWGREGKRKREKERDLKAQKAAAQINYENKIVSIN